MLELSPCNGGYVAAIRVKTEDTVQIDGEPQNLEVYEVQTFIGSDLSSLIGQLAPLIEANAAEYRKFGDAFVSIDTEKGKPKKIGFKDSKE